MTPFFKRPVRGSVCSSIHSSLKVAALALAIGLPTAAHAHHPWMLPSATVFSGNDPWVTVDAAISNDLFFFEDFPLRLEGLLITGPDGKSVETANANTGKRRSTFDVQLMQSGTYKLAIISSGLNASFKVNGQQKRLRGTPESLAKDIPADAQDVKVTQSQGRVETFITAGKPNKTALAVTGSGLELLPVTNPTDLVVGDTATFQFFFDGKPAAGVDVNIVPGGIRYRDKLLDTKTRTDPNGKVNVTWTGPGVYLMEASMANQKPTVARATERRASYSVTLEVLP
jgi:uncharacterized GH25 family protein